MSRRQLSALAAEEEYKSVTGIWPASDRTGLLRLAAIVDLASRHSRHADPRALGTPDRSVAIPYGGRRTQERGSSGDHFGQHLTETSVNEPLDLMILLRSMLPGIKKAVMLFATESVVIAIEVRSVTGITTPDGSSARGSSRGTVGECPAARPS